VSCKAGGPSWRGSGARCCRSDSRGCVHGTFPYTACMSSDELPPWDRDDDLLTTAAAGGVVLRVAAWDRLEIVVGRGGDPAREVRLAAAHRDGVPVLRRRGGGCAVVLDRGNVVVSLAMPLPGVGRVTSAFRAITAWLVEGLTVAGCPGVGSDGVSDLVRDGRKVGGSCIYRTRGLLHYSTTLLASPDLDAVERYLPHPPREPAYRCGRSHRDFLTSVTGAPAPSPALLARRLRRVLDVAALRSVLDPGD